MQKHVSLSLFHKKQKGRRANCPPAFCKFTDCLYAFLILLGPGNILPIGVARSIDLEALQIGTVSPDNIHIIYGDMRAVLIKISCGLLKYGQPFGLVQSLGSRRPQLIKMCIVGPGEVGAAYLPGCELVLDEAKGIRCGAAADGGFKVALGSGRQVCSQVHGLQLHIDAYLAEGSLDNFAGAALGVVRADTAEGNGGGIKARRLEPLLGKINIILIQVPFGMSGEHGRRLHIVARAGAVQRDLNQLILVDGAVKGMAEVLIVEGGLLIVQSQEIKGSAGDIDDRYAVGLLKPCQVVGLDLDDHIDLAGLKGDGAGRTFGNDPLGHLLDGGSVAPLFFIFFKHFVF